MPVTRIGIVDDHAITLRALHEFLREQEGFLVAGQAASGREAIDLARKVPMDVMLLDIDMPGQSGIESIAHIMARAPSMAVLMLSSHAPSHYGMAMMKKGASGYLDKQCDPSEIVTAIRTVAGGRKYLNEEMSALLLDNLTPVTDGAAHKKLTDREFQVFIRLARGQSPDDAGIEMSLSGKTVSSYRTRIMDKLHFKTNSELTYYAIKHGLIE